MNRRAFIGSLIGGVAATAAVRTWPFRVFSFPSKPIALGQMLLVRKPPRWDAGFNVFDYAGIPIVEDTDCPPGYVFTLSDRYIAGPDSIKQIMNIRMPKQQRMAHCRIDGLQV